MNEDIPVIPRAEDIPIEEVETNFEETPPAVVSLGDAVQDTARLIMDTKKKYRLKEETVMNIFQIHLQLMNMERDRVAGQQPSGQELIDQIAREQAEKETREPDETIDE